MTLASSAAAGGELPCDAHYGDAARAVRVATGSPGELGLLRELALAFHGGHGAAVCWRKAGTGKALELLRAGDVDVVLVHAPDAERAAVAGGWAASRTLIGGNEFFIVGPAADPAGVAAAGSAVEAFRRIARAGAPFVSRADNSGTHQRETAIWREAGVQPAGAWYVEAPGFMVEGLKETGRRGAYFLTDSSTWLSLPGGIPGLTLLFRGDPVLVNRYHALVRNGADDDARAFVAYVAGPEGQSIIATFSARPGGEPLYLPAAKLAH